MFVVVVERRVAVCVARLYLYFFERFFELLDDFMFELEATDAYDRDRDESSFEFKLSAI